MESEYERFPPHDDAGQAARQRERMELDADMAAHIAASAVRISVGADGAIHFTNLPHGGQVTERPDGMIITASRSPSGSIGFGFMEPLHERPKELPEE